MASSPEDTERVRVHVQEWFPICGHATEERLVQDILALQFQLPREWSRKGKRGAREGELDL